MFGVLWPGARALARRVAAADLAGSSTIELGCGLALPSIVAASRGARALATDNHPHAGRFLGANAHHNAVEVAWRELDWRAPPGDLGTFDRVIASDLLFSEALAPFVAGAIAATLAPSGEAWLVDPGRLALATFERAARERGLTVEVDVFDEDGRELYGLTLRHIGA